MAGKSRVANAHSVQAQDLGRLDELLEQLRNEAGEQCALLREHLESARIYLAGSMPEEYALSLTMAAETVNCVSDPHLRKRITDFIHGV